MIYFDNAATGGKKPESVIKAVNNALYSYSANPGRSGHTLSLKAAEMVYKAREKTASFFGAVSPENVIFTSGCTQSINYVLKGVLESNDHIVISSLEHNAVLRPIVKMGNPYSIAQVDLYDSERTFENFKNAVNKDTKMIFCTMASNVLGVILPIKKIGSFCKEKGILFAVDAAQAAGVLPINVSEMGIDYLCVAPHKGLFAPMGIGVLIASKEIKNTIIEGGTGTNSLEYTQPLYLPEKLESGTLNLPGIVGLYKGIEYAEKQGIERIYRKEMQLAQKVYYELSGMEEISLYTPFPEIDKYVAVLSFNFKGETGEKTASFLDKRGIAVRGGYHCSPLAHEQIGTLETGTARLSFSHFNNFSEVGEFLRVIKLKKH